MSYIKREDALDAVLFALVGTGYQSNAIYAIRDVPTADVVEVRHGYWLSAYEYSLKFDISEEHRNEVKNDRIWKFCCLCDQAAKWDYNYCPNRGAKMDGERREQ